MPMKTGFIYRNEKGEFLLRIINRGHFDEDHYILKFVTTFEWGCLFYSEIVIDDNDRDSLTRIKYRTLFSKEVIADCICENVVVGGDAYHGFELEVVMTQGFEMKNTHDLKTDTKVFQDVLDGNKTFEIRFNDRDFQVGDSVLLKETKFTGEQIESGQPLIFTGREIHKRISYLLSGYGLQDGWVILGIADEAGQQSQQAKIDELKMSNHHLSVQLVDSNAHYDHVKKERDELQAKYDELNNRATGIALDQMATAKLNYELQKRIDEALHAADESCGVSVAAFIKLNRILKGDS